MGGVGRGGGCRLVHHHHHTLTPGKSSRMSSKVTPSGRLLSETAYGGPEAHMGGRRGARGGGGG